MSPLSRLMLKDNKSGCLCSSSIGYEHFKFANNPEFRQKHVGSDMSEEGLMRQKNTSLIALDEATSSLDNYYMAVAAGRTNDSP